MKSRKSRINMKRKCCNVGIKPLSLKNNVGIKPFSLKNKGTPSNIQKTMGGNLKYYGMLWFDVNNYLITHL